jgi:hypothetical protein
MSLLYGSWLWVKSLFSIVKYEPSIDIIRKIHADIHAINVSIKDIDRDNDSNKTSMECAFNRIYEMEHLLRKSEPRILDMIIQLKISLDRLTLDYECILKRHIQQISTPIKERPIKKPIKNPRKIRPKKVPSYVCDTHS